MRTAILSVAFCTTAGMATAATVIPVSYDMPNGSNAFYLDDAYSGGNNTIPGAALSGGRGDLTDGVIATQSWFVDRLPYVGWLDVNPVISFHFDQVYSFLSMTLHFDDAGGVGAVSQPGSVVIAGTTYVVPDNPGTAPFAFTANLRGVADDSFSVQIFGTDRWVFLSEVSFQGVAPAPTVVPLPAAGLLLLGAIGGLAALRRRKRT